MRNKYSRHSAIRVIIAGQRISSQDELLQQLLVLGYECTQATLSRDLKELEVTKEVVGGESIYLLPDSPMHPRADVPYGIQLRGGVQSIDFSGNVAVLKTRRGYARGIAVDIDRCGLRTVLGTVAGDDTILLVIGEGYAKSDVLTELEGIIPDIMTLIPTKTKLLKSL